MPAPEWHYTGTVIRWVDGDTVDMRVEKVIDVGFRIQQTAAYTGRFRLVTVDTPEQGDPGYEEAREFCESWLPPGSTVDVTTYKSDSFGRWLADLRFPGAPGTASRSMSELLLRHGHAEVWS